MDRLAYLDAAKVLAVFAVVAIHIFGVSFATRDPGTPGWWLANVLYTGSRWSVPMFVMASGAVLNRPLSVCPDHACRPGLRGRGGGRWSSGLTDRSRRTTATLR